jgi:hypothetical protein
MYGILIAAYAVSVFCAASSWSQTSYDTSRPDSGRSSAMYREGPVKGRMIDAGFLLGETNYHAVQQASDGCVYFGIGSHAPGASATLFRFDPRSGAVKALGSMNEVVGEDGSKVFNQGKIHCDLYEMKGKLYFSTQGGYYQGGNYGPFPGGHFLSYDLSSGKFTDYGIGAPGEGMVTMTMDTDRGRMYAVTWPGMHFIYYDVPAGRKKDFGKAVATPGITDLTSVPGNRSLAMDPRDGNVYWHNMDETISRYDFLHDSIDILEHLRLDIPILRTARGGFDKVLWRSIRWSPAQQRFYGVIAGSEYLFSFEPKSGTLEIIDRIAAGPNRRSGATAGSSLAFELDAEGNTIYYIASSRSRLHDRTTREELRLVTFDIPHRRYIDHGPVELEDGRYPNGCSGLDVGRDGILYLVCTIPLVNFESDREKRIIKAHFADVPLEKLKDSAYEVNLVAVKSPLTSDR